MQNLKIRGGWRLVAFLVFVSALALGAPKAGFLKTYKGTPFHDSRYAGGAQKIPGKVFCAYYDLGGEGVAYHDSDAKNNGSGALNPADGSYLHEFRMSEGVDTSFTKFGQTPQIDDNPFDKVTPEANLLYVGWTEPGEWFNMTVDATEAGDYAADLLYTSNRGGTISLSVNGAAVNGQAGSGAVYVDSTFDAADPVAWRQWHHWNMAKGIARVHLAKGRNVLTVHILTGGNINLAWLDFKKVG